MKHFRNQSRESMTLALLAVFTLNRFWHPLPPPPEMVRWADRPEGSMLVDSRPLSDFQRAHLDGACSLPECERIPASLLDKSATPKVVVYSDSDHLAPARRTAQRLAYARDDSVRILVESPLP